VRLETRRDAGPVFEGTEAAFVMSEFLSPRQVADELQLGESTVYRALEDGRLPGQKICGRWRTLRSQLVERVRDGRVPISRSDFDPMPPARPRQRGSVRSKVIDIEARRQSA
jgi:excisionase family DNA binding protein